MNNQPHRVKVTISQINGIGMDMVCDAPEGAPCRMWCDEGCEFATPEHLANHRLRDQGYCTKTEGWFDEDDPIDLYVGPPTELRSGPVEVIWDDDHYTWRYSDDEAGENDE